MEYEPKLIISLTTWYKRVSTVHLVLNTLVNQSKEADMIILCINKEELDAAQIEIPTQVNDLVNKGLVTILWAENLKSYKKLVPALMQFPNDIIVTADDDILYPSNWLELLHDSYLKYPKTIHCHKASYFLFDKNFNFPPNRNASFDLDKLLPFNAYFVGCSGVLYPPHCLYADVTKKEIFMQIASENDDVWFWAMATLKRTRIVKIKNAITDNPEVEGTDEHSLFATMNSKGHGENQLEQIMKRYPRLKRIIYWDVRWFKYLNKVKALFISKS